jgi:hypothetical protein
MMVTEQVIRFSGFDEELTDYVHIPELSEYLNKNKLVPMVDKIFIWPETNEHFTIETVKYRYIGDVLHIFIYGQPQ